MKTFADGDSVFVAADDFRDLQESQAVFGSCHGFCVAAVAAMITDGASKHVSYVNHAELSTANIVLKEGGLIPKVTIEWVDASEASTEMFQPGGVSAV